MKFRFIVEHTVEFGVRSMCRVLKVSPSGYYAWCSRPESSRSQEDRRLRVKIRAFHAASRGTYGSPRIYEDLQEDGETCGRERVARLMREEGLAGKKRRRFRSTTDSKHSNPVVGNKLDQKFTVETPNTVWAGDITYLRTREGWLYLAVLLDLYSRFVVGWSVSSFSGRTCRKSLNPWADLFRGGTGRNRRPALSFGRVHQPQHVAPSLFSRC